MLTYLILGMLGALAGYTVYTLTVEVLDVRENAGKSDAALMYREV